MYRDAFRSISIFFIKMMSIRLKSLWMVLLTMGLALFAACTELTEADDVEELTRKGDNAFTVAGVTTLIGECLDGYAETEGGVVHLLHFYTIGFYHMNGDGTCSVNTSFKKTGAYVELPLLDKGQTELSRLLSGTYLSQYATNDEWSGDYYVTKSGVSTLRALTYDKLTDLQTSTVQVKKKGDIYEITWEGRDERGNVCSLYYFGQIQSEKMMDEN